MAAAEFHEFTATGTNAWVSPTNLKLPVCASPHLNRITTWEERRQQLAVYFRDFFLRRCLFQLCKLSENLFIAGMRLFETKRLNNSKVMQSKSSIMLDASKYIVELKRKIEKLNPKNATTENSAGHGQIPAVRMESHQNGFTIKVASERSCPGLLVFILEAFEELGLVVLQARVASLG
ncbi:hypothetical protein RJ641_032686 [Dillenia turbinata]|uniref:Plant bHLH transcription factor ACT-like domain-containing protein n=1 Tax=Dillenia turbinata TaxID=194707 RepID=A0AAN8ZF28_9MAGN